MGTISGASESMSSAVLGICWATVLPMAGEGMGLLLDLAGSWQERVLLTLRRTKWLSSHL